MPAVVPFIPLIAAAVTVGTGAVLQNQQTQHTKGAAQAQQTAMDQQVATANAQDTASQTQKANSASATQAAALAALRASMSTNTSMGGSILTGPSGAAPAPTVNKTLLGA